MQEESGRKFEAASENSSVGAEGGLLIISVLWVKGNDDGKDEEDGDSAVDMLEIVVFGFINMLSE